MAGLIYTMLSPCLCFFQFEFPDEGSLFADLYSILLILVTQLECDICVDKLTSFQFRCACSGIWRPQITFKTLQAQTACISGGLLQYVDSALQVCLLAVGIVVSLIKNLSKEWTLKKCFLLLLLFLVLLLLVLLQVLLLQVNAARLLGSSRLGSKPVQYIILSIDMDDPRIEWKNTYII